VNDIENPKKVIAQYEAVRRSGLTNMFDKNAVQRIAFDSDFYDLVNLITDGGYAEILTGYSELMKLIDEDDIPEI